jgi:hypothetical protein
MPDARPTSGKRLSKDLRSSVFNIIDLMCVLQII